MKESNLKKLYTMWLQFMTFCKRQNYVDSKKISGCQGLGRGRRDEQGEQREFLRQWKLLCMIPQRWLHAIMYFLYLSKSTDYIQHQEWTIMEILDFGNYINLSLSILIPSWEMLIIGKVCVVCRGRENKGNLCAFFSILVWI